MVEFNPEEKALIVRRIRDYFETELEQEIGQFDAEFLLGFFSEQIGVYFYNKGLRDAQAVVSERMENVIDAIYEKEKPTEFPK